MAANDQKTEKPTPKHKKDQKRKGQVVRSPELLSWSSVLAATFLIQATVKLGVSQFRSMFALTGGAIENPDTGVALQLFGKWLWTGLIVLSPLVLGLLVVGVGLNYAQVGWWPSGGLVKPKFSRVSPVGGLKRLFGPTTAFGAFKELVKLTVVGFLAYRAVTGVAPELIDQGRLSVPAITSLTAGAALRFIRQVAILGLVIAAIDYGFQRKRVNKQLMMTKQMIKEEHRQQEGDPLLKQAIRQRQMLISRNRMMAQLPFADVVVVNPTHVAVALRYDTARGGAPRVVAKGAGVVATKIREEAARHRIPMVEDIPLARTIYRLCNLNDEIPAELYDAVARLLAFIYGLKARGVTSEGIHQLAAPLLSV